MRCDSVTAATSMSVCLPVRQCGLGDKLSLIHMVDGVPMVVELSVVKIQQKLIAVQLMLLDGWLSHLLVVKCANVCWCSEVMPFVFLILYPCLWIRMVLW